MDSHNLAQNAILVTGAAGAIILMLRQAILSYFSAKNQVVAATAQDNVIERLESEIKRLEEIIRIQHDEHRRQVKEMNEQMSALERQLNEIRDVELQDAADIMELSILMRTFCANCISNPDNENMHRVQAVIEQLRIRKMKRGRNVNPNTTG